MDGSKITWSSFDFLNEKEFEEILLKRSILKEYSIHDAKKTINIFRKYNRYADVLLIEKDFKYWCVGEVEISKHSFSGHVFPQLIEIYQLMEQNVDLIRKSYLNIPTLNIHKELEDLVKFNKPFLNLIIDKIPSTYSNIIPILNSFCNVTTVNRMTDSEQNYSYVVDNHYVNIISKSQSTCFINDVVLIIDYPNLLDMNKKEYEYFLFKGEKIYIQQHFSIIEGKETLFWIIEKKINDGKYFLTKENNELILIK